MNKKQEIIKSVEEYIALVFPNVELSPSQAREVALAFYAGMAQCLGMVLRAEHEQDLADLDHAIGELARKTNENRGAEKN